MWSEAEASDVTPQSVELKNASRFMAFNSKLMLKCCNFDFEFKGERRVVPVCSVSKLDCSRQCCVGHV